MPEPENQLESIWITLESPADVVSQGDLFYFEEQEANRRYGIVVTADCDLTNRKHSKLVSLVPLVELEEILTGCLYVDHLEMIRSQLETMLHKQLGADVATTDPAFAASISAILQEHGSIPSEVFEAASVYLHRSDRVSTQHFKKILCLLGNSINKAYDRFAQQIKSRGDIIVLSRPPLAPHDVRIAWLRQVWQVNLGALVLRTSAYLPNNQQGQHVARLASPFRYRLTQQFAQVFSDIGTPDVAYDWIATGLEEKCNGV